MKTLFHKFATLALLIALYVPAVAEPPRNTPGTEHFGPAPQQPASNPAAQKEEKGGSLITEKKMMEVYANEYAQRMRIAGDKLIFTKTWRTEDVKAVMGFYNNTQWLPEPRQFDPTDPARQHARDMFNVLLEYSQEQDNRRQIYRMIYALRALRLTERVRKIYISLDCFDWAKDNLLPMLRKYDAAYDKFMSDVRVLNSAGRLNYGAGAGELPQGWQILNRSGMALLMKVNGQPNPSFDRAIRTLDQACTTCSKPTLDELKNDLERFHSEVLSAQHCFKAAVKKIEKFPGFSDVMYIASADDDIIQAATEFYEQAMKMLKDLDDNGTIYGQLRHFKGINGINMNDGALVQDGVTYSDTGTPVYRRKVRRGFEEMKAAYEKWASTQSRYYNNARELLQWSY